MKKFLKSFLALALTTCIFTSINVYADENINLNSTEAINIISEDSGISVDEFIEKEGILSLDVEAKADIIDKNVTTDKSTISDKITVDNLLGENKARASENTDPNNAYVINFGQAVGGTITSEGEQRWYGVQLDEKAKISSALAVADSSDFDLYLFKLDIDTMSLHVVAGAASGDAGVTEYFDYIADSGIYYFMVNSHSGTGQYALVAYKATNNIANEPNDTLSTATEVDEKGFSITDAIDNPFDVDYYKANYTQNKFVNVSFTKPDDSDYMLYIVNNNKVYNINYDTPTRLDPGEYYYYVMSPSGSFDENATYDIKVTSTSYYPSDNIVMYTPTRDMILQVNSDRTSYYVNGNIIDFSFSFENHVSNKYASADTYMDLYRQPNQNVALFESEVSQMTSAGFYDAELPQFVKYTTNWFGSYSTDKALLLTLFNTKLDIKRNATGEYSNTRYPAETWNLTKVVVDVETGKIIDIFYPNIYYMVGNQTHRALYVYTCNYGYDTRK